MKYFLMLVRCLGLALIAVGAFALIVQRVDPELSVTLAIQWGFKYLGEILVGTLAVMLTLKKTDSSD